MRLHAKKYKSVPANNWHLHAGFEDRLVDLYLSKRTSDSSLGVSDIAVYKLPLIMLSHGCWDHAACIALLMAEFSLTQHCWVRAKQTQPVTPCILLHLSQRKALAAFHW